MLFKDARDYQILFLSLFLILGIGTRDWTLKPELIVIAIATCLITQWVAILLKPLVEEKIHKFLFKEKKTLITPPPSFSFRSAAITGLGLCLLLRSDSYLTMMIAASCAILSKFIFQIEGKHFFNPANFGIIFVLTFTSDAWVSPGQWGEDWWFGMLFFGTGGLVLKKVGRWDTTAAFLGFYTLLETIRNFWLGWTFDVLVHRLTSGSLLLFALFMITDPRSIPNAKISRLIWAIALASLTFIFRNYFFLSTAMFWALFALSPAIVWLDYLWSAPRFSWFNPRNIMPNLTKNTA